MYVFLLFFSLHLLILEMKSMGFDDNKYRNHNDNVGCCYPFYAFYRNNRVIVSILVGSSVFGVVYCFYFPSVTLFSPVLDSGTGFLLNKALPPEAILPELEDFPPFNESRASSAETVNSQNGKLFH